VNVLSFDNGISGAWCALDMDGKILHRSNLPIFTKFGKTEINVLGLTEQLSPILDRDLAIVIEEPLKHAPSAASHASMGRSFGRITAWVELVGHDWIPVDPRHWQKRILGKCPQGTTKIKALEIAREIWPDEDWLATKRSTVPSSGIIDAALLGLDFIRQQNKKTK